jgi:hypothetical protein
MRGSYARLGVSSPSDLALPGLVLLVIGAGYARPGFGCPKAWLSLFISILGAETIEHWLTMIQLGFPTAHRLTFLSSPPVTRTLPDLWPSARQFTVDVWATISSAKRNGEYEVS